MEENTQPISQAPPQPKKQSGVLIGILLFLLGILIGLALGKTTLISALRIPYFGVTQTPTLLPTPSPTPDPTANWKLYSTSRGFSFRYPADYEVVERVPGFFVITAPQNSGKSQAGITIETRAQSPYDNYQRANEYFYDNFQISDDHSIKDQTDKSVSQVVWTSFRGIGKKDMLKGLHFLIGYKQYNNIGVIVAETLAASTESVYFDQILSTFMFTEPNTYTCPANGWVDCMPGTTVKPECSPAAMTWYQANCPDFKGGAL